MDCPACANDPCTCQTERLPNPSTVIRSTYQPVPLGITKEEFGLNLYEAIKLISALKTIREQLNYAVHKHQEKRQQELTARYKNVRQELASHLPTLTDHETQQILARYPNVATM